jgi:glycosyltransferase involved in cell wall biosynthesis
MTAPLRLAMTVTDFAARRPGGVARWTRLVAEGLAARGHDVTVLCTAAPDATLAPAHVRQVALSDDGPQGACDALGLPEGLAAASRRRHDAVRRLRPTVVSTPIVDVEGAATLTAGDPPCVLSLHSCAGLAAPDRPDWHGPDGEFLPDIAALIRAERAALCRAPMLLANSHAVLDDLARAHDLDLRARPHRIVPHGLPDIAAPETIHRDPAAALRLLFVGRIEPRKGIAHLVPALERLLADHETAEADIVGQKTDTACAALLDSLLAAHPGRVRWHSWLEQHEIDPLMRAADIFVAPALYESFGLTYAEAMRYGLPSVGFAAGGVPEVVTDGVDGLLASTGDTAALAAALDRLARDPQMRRALGREARRSFEARFALAPMVAALEAVYTDVAIGGATKGTTT